MRFLLNFFIGTHGAFLWNGIVYLLYIVPVFWFVEDLRFIDKSVSGAPQGLGISVFLIVTGFVAFVDLMIHAAMQPAKGFMKYVVHGIEAAVYAVSLGLLFWKLFETKAAWAAPVLGALAVLAFLIHLTAVWISGRRLGSPRSRI